MKRNNGLSHGQRLPERAHSPVQQPDKPVESVFDCVSQNSLHAQPDGGGETIFSRGVVRSTFQHETAKPRAKASVT